MKVHSAVGNEGRSVVQLTKFCETSRHFDRSHIVLSLPKSDSEANREGFSISSSMTLSSAVSASASHSFFKSSISASSHLF